MKRLWVVVLIVAGVITAQAQKPNKSINIHPPRPKVGVVLGGGGAKGAAHIGVLKYLEEVGIPIDYVAGTSMGSIIGGLYAMGYSPDELATLIANMNWSEYVGNRIDRSALSTEVRQRTNTLSVIIPFSLDGVVKNKPKRSPISFIPNAYVNNTALINLFNDLCIGYQKEMDFNDLPIPFACVATDVKTGEEIVIRHGSVPTAMRASMAIPGVFSPVYMNGHLLVDGGLVNNFPADVLEDMGADIIIGVEVSGGEKIEDEEMVSLPELLGSLLSNAVSSKREENQMRCNLYLNPDISGYGTLSFTPEAIETLVNRGYQKASEFQAPLSFIKHHIDSINGSPLCKQLHAPKAKNLEEEPVVINAITIKKNDNSQSNWLIRKGGLEIGKPISKKDLDRAVDIYRGTGAFDDIIYNITENGKDSINGEWIDTYKLDMDFKPTQPHIFGLGFRYDTEEGAALLINVNLNGKKFDGSKLNITGRLSYNPKFSITYTYALASVANFNLSYDFRNQHFMMGSINLNYKQHKLSGYVSPFHMLNFNTAVGVSYHSTSFGHFLEYEDIDSTILMPHRIVSPFFNLEYDNRDDANFARHGIFTRIGGHFYYDSKLAENGKSADLCFSFQYNITTKDGSLTFIPQLYGRHIFGFSPHYNLWVHCGGDIAGRHFDEQLPFVGISNIKTLINSAGIIRCDIRYNIYGKHYLTAIYNHLTWNTFKELDHANGVGLRYSYNSIAGPISLTSQWSDLTKKASFYLSLGYYF